MAKIGKYQDANLDKDLDKLHADLKQVKADAKKQRSVVRDDKIDSGKMEEGKVYVQNVGGTVYLKIKVDGVVKTATLS